MRGFVFGKNPGGFLIGSIFLALAVLHSPSVGATVCSVPTLAYPSIQAAVDDGACTEIELAAQDFVGSVAVSRSLELDGVSSATTTIEGQVTVSGASAEVTLNDLKVDGGGCHAVALNVGDGAQVTSGPDVVVANAAGGECPIFIDGFELGAAAAWSSTTQ